MKTLVAALDNSEESGRVGQTKANTRTEASIHLHSSPGGLWETPSAWQLSSAGEELIAEGLVQLHYPSMLRPKHGTVLLLDHVPVTFRHNTVELEVQLFGPTND